MPTKLNELTNQILVAALKSFKGQENSVQAHIIRYLSEFDNRKLYRDLGYSSLFTYCTETLGYSAGAAYTRVQAARCLKDNPEIFELIRDGKVTICSVAEIAKIKVQSVKSEIIQEAIGKSKEEVKMLTIPHLPVEEIKREVITPKNVEVAPDLFSEPSQTESPLNQKETRFNFSIEVDGDFMRLYNEAKALVGHVPANEVFKRALKGFIEKKTEAPKRRVAESQGRSLSRYISKADRFEVRKRDGGRCTYIAPDGKRCSERHGLEFDHIMPFGKGGDNSVQNIRLLCRAHNQLHAENCYPDLAGRFGGVRETDAFYDNV